MVVAGDALVRQADHRAAAAGGVVGFREGVGAGGHHGPHGGGRHIGELLADIVAVVEGHRDVLLYHGVVSVAVHLGRRAGLDGHDGGHVVGVTGHLPAGQAALGVGHQDGVLAGAVIDLVDGCRHRPGHHFVVDVLVAGGVVHAGIRGHLAEKLVQDLLPLGELGALVVGELVIEISADAELGVPGLVGWGGGHGACHGGLTGLAPAGLVDEPDAVAHPQEHVTPALPAVGGGHPAHAGLAVAVEKHHGQLRVVLGDLVEHIGVVHVGGRALPGGVVVGHVEGTVGFDHGAAGGEDALLGDDQGVGAGGLFHGRVLPGVRRVGGGAAAPCRQGEGQDAGQGQSQPSAVVFHSGSSFLILLKMLPAFHSRPAEYGGHGDRVQNMVDLRHFGGG